MSGIDRKFRVRGDLAGSREETLLELAAEETGESCIDHTTEPISMDKDQSHVTEKILDLTLEIISVLTGEDCEIVKKLSREPLTPSKRLHETLPLTVLPPHCLTPESKAKKILEVTKKITELLTGEVPEKDEDITVSVKGYVEGHKELYKDVMMASPPALTSPDGSSNGNPPERCPRPLSSRRSIQKNCSTPHHHQGSKGKGIKNKVIKEKEETVSGDQPSMEEEEEEEMIMESKPEESSLYIDTSGHYVPTSSKDRPLSSPGNKVNRKKVTKNISGANLTERSTDPSNSNESSLSHEKDGAKLLSCSVCGKSFTDKSDLFCHLKTHTDVFPYSCTECGTCFSQERSLRLHRQFHTGARPYLCLECGKCYNQKKHLYSHQRLHLGVRPYSCSICERGFATKQSFLIHERVHTGDKPYSCKECGRRFAQQSNLLRHQRSHTGVRRFICSECAKSFTDKRNLIRHLKKHHNIQWNPNIGNEAPGHPV